MSATAHLLGVCLGAGIGAQARYLLDLLFMRQNPAHHYRATLIANLLGSGLLGVILGVLNHLELLAQPPWWSTVLTAGIAGGLTTFSTFAAQVIERAHVSKKFAALLVAAHGLLGFLAALTAWWVTWKTLN